MNKIENNMYYQTNIKTSRNKDINFLQLSYGNFVSLDDYILLKKENQQLIDYLKEQITLCNERIDFHKSEISGVTNISDDNRHLILIKKNKIRKESFEEILSKIEKR